MGDDGRNPARKKTSGQATQVLSGAAVETPRRQSELGGGRLLAEEPVEDVAPVREVSAEEARDQILTLLAERPGLDAFDLAIELGFDVGLAHEVCEQLMTEGRIAAHEKPPSRE